MMHDLEVTSEIALKEAIMSIEISSLSDDDNEKLVLTTINGDVRVYDYVSGDKNPLQEVCVTSGFPPVSTLALGDVTGNGVTDFILGCMDNTMRTVVLSEGELEEISSTPLGGLPTAICALNVLDDDAAEVVVASNDGALRCYQWFDVVLDKLAHKVLEHPVFSIRPLSTRGVSYSRFVFGDESGNLYVYQYADDRLHERTRVKLQGDVNLVATGNILDDRNDEILTVSDGRRLTLLTLDQGGISVLDRIRAPSPITSVRLGVLQSDESSEGLIISCQGNSKVTIFSFEENQMKEQASIKTAKKSVEAQIAMGDLSGDGSAEIVQAVRNSIYVMSLVEE
ncbi:MAG: hypothetical protein JSW61_05335 [Candidatus Thorarchaeota archaeon]|nr:MAG: hypothetical protein JSW61_05335 [Candidatus Thorarchaeota archaeon]